MQSHEEKSMLVNGFMLVALVFMLTIFSSIPAVSALEYFTIDSYSDWFTKNASRPINVTADNITAGSTTFTDGLLQLDFNLSDIIIDEDCTLGPGVASANQCNNGTGGTGININDLFMRNESANYSIFARNFSILTGKTVSIASFNSSASVGNQSGNFTIFANEIHIYGTLNASAAGRAGGSGGAGGTAGVGGGIGNPGGGGGYGNSTSPGANESQTGVCCGGGHGGAQAGLNSGSGESGENATTAGAGGSGSHGGGAAAYGGSGGAGGLGGGGGNASSGTGGGNNTNSSANAGTAYGDNNAVMTSFLRGSGGAGAGGGGGGGGRSGSGQAGEAGLAGNGGGIGGGAVMLRANYIRIDGGVINVSATGGGNGGNGSIGAEVTVASSTAGAGGGGGGGAGGGSGGTIILNATKVELLSTAKLLADGGGGGQGGRGGGCGLAELGENAALTGGAGGQGGSGGGGGRIKIFVWNSTFYVKGGSETITAAGGPAGTEGSGNGTNCLSAGANGASGNAGSAGTILENTANLGSQPPLPRNLGGNYSINLTTFRKADWRWLNITTSGPQDASTNASVYVYTYDGSSTYVLCKYITDFTVAENKNLSPCTNTKTLILNLTLQTSRANNFSTTVVDNINVSYDTTVNITQVFVNRSVSQNGASSNTGQLERKYFNRGQTINITGQIIYNSSGESVPSQSFTFNLTNNGLTSFTTGEDYNWNTTDTDKSDSYGSNISTDSDGNFTFMAFVNQTAKDFYDASTPNSTSEVLSYKIIVQNQSNVQNSSGAGYNTSALFDVDSQYYLPNATTFAVDASSGFGVYYNVTYVSTHRILNRGDVQRVNSTFVTVQNTTVRSGTNVTTEFVNPSDSVIYTNFTQTSGTAGRIANVENTMGNGDVLGNWSVNFTINYITDKADENWDLNYNNSLANGSSCCKVPNAFNVSNYVRMRVGPTFNVTGTPGSNIFYQKGETMYVTGNLVNAAGNAYSRYDGSNATSSNATITVQLFSLAIGNVSVENTTLQVNRYDGNFTAIIHLNPSVVADVYNSTSPNVAQDGDGGANYSLYFFDQGATSTSVANGNFGNVTNQFDIDASVYLSNHYQNDADSDATDTDFNTGDSDNLNVNTNYARVYVKNVRDELTNFFGNLQVNRSLYYPNNSTRHNASTLTLTNTGSGGLYKSDFSGVETFQNFTAFNISYWTFWANDTNQNNVSLNLTGANLNITNGKTRYWYTNLSLNDTHVLRTQSTNVTVYAFNAYDDMADNGKIDRSTGKDTTTTFTVDVWDVFDNETVTGLATPSAGQFSYQNTSSDFQTGENFVYTYTSTDIIEQRDARVNIESGEIGGLDWFNRTDHIGYHMKQKPDNDDNGAWTVDDLYVGSYTFYHSNGTAMRTFVPLANTSITDTTASQLNITGRFNMSFRLNQTYRPTTEPYQFINITLYEWDNQTTHNNTASASGGNATTWYYNQSRWNFTTTESDGNVTIVFRLFPIAEAGKDWHANTTTNLNTSEQFFDVDLVVNQTVWWARNQSDTSKSYLNISNRSYIEWPYYNRGEPARAYFHLQNNPERDTPTVMKLHDIGGGVDFTNIVLNSSGEYNESIEGIIFNWSWPATVIENHTLNGTNHTTQLEATIGNLNTRRNSTENPNISSLFLIDSHKQINFALAVDTSNRTYPENDNKTENDSFILTRDLQRIWVYAANIRAEPINGISTYFWEYPDARDRLWAVDNSFYFTGTTNPVNDNDNRDGWNDRQEKSPVAPSGRWKTEAVINSSGTLAGNNASTSKNVTFIGAFRGDYNMIVGAGNKLLINDTVRAGSTALLGFRIEKDGAAYTVDSGTVPTVRIGRFNVTDGTVYYEVGNATSGASMTLDAADNSIWTYDWVVRQNIIPDTYFYAFRADVDFAPIHASGSLEVGVQDKLIHDRQMLTYITKRNGTVDDHTFGKGDKIGIYASFMKNTTSVYADSIPYISIYYDNETLGRIPLAGFPALMTNITNRIGLYEYNYSIPSNANTTSYLVVINSTINNFNMTESTWFRVSNRTDKMGSPLSLSCSQQSEPNKTVYCIATAKNTTGEFITGQSITYNVLWQNLTALAQGTMSELSAGTYYFSFTPTKIENYLVYANFTLVDLLVSGNFSSSTTLFSQFLGLRTEQNSTLYNASDYAKQLNTTLLDNKNFGGNNLSDIRTRLIDLKNFLILLQQESKENVFLVTDAIYSTNALIDKYENGEISSADAKKQIAQIHEQVKPAIEEVANLKSFSSSKKEKSPALAGVLGGGPLSISIHLDTIIYYFIIIIVVVVAILGAYLLEIDRKIVRWVLLRKYY